MVFITSDLPFQDSAPQSESARVRAAFSGNLVLDEKPVNQGEVDLERILRGLEGWRDTPQAPMLRSSASVAHSDAELYCWVCRLFTQGGELHFGEKSQMPEALVRELACPDKRTGALIRGISRRPTTR